LKKDNREFYDEIAKYLGQDKTAELANAIKIKKLEIKQQKIENEEVEAQQNKQKEKKNPKHADEEI